MIGNKKVLEAVAAAAGLIQKSIISLDESSELDYYTHKDDIQKFCELFLGISIFWTTIAAIDRQKVASHCS